MILMIQITELIISLFGDNVMIEYSGFGLTSLSIPTYFLCLGVMRINGEMKMGKNRRTLIKEYMEYEFGDGTEERINYIMDFVNEYDNDIYVDMENQVCNDVELMNYVQERLIEEN